MAIDFNKLQEHYNQLEKDMRIEVMWCSKCEAEFEVTLIESVRNKERLCGKCKAYKKQVDKWSKEFDDRIDQPGRTRIY